MTVTQQVPRYSDITPVLKNLHWLPIVFQGKFKMALQVSKALKVMTPLSEWDVTTEAYIALSPCVLTTKTF